jgi:hypothetical protein
MTPALGKLIEIGGAPFVRGSKPVGDAVSRVGDIGASIAEVLARKNGFFASSLLCVFSHQAPQSLPWVSQSGIRSTFGKATIGAWLTTFIVLQKKYLDDNS